MRAYDRLEDLRLDPRRSTPHLDVRAVVLDVLREAGEIEVDELPVRTEEEVAGMEPHVFLAWCRDGDADYFAAIPASLISPQLEAALDALRSTPFVGAEDFTPDGFAALLRIWATICTTLDGRVPASDLLRWAAQETGHWREADRAKLPDATELTALQDRWKPGFGMTASHYDRRYVRVLALRQQT